MSDEATDYINSVIAAVDRVKKRNKVRFYYDFNRKFNGNGFAILRRLKEYADSVGWFMETKRCQACSVPHWDIIIGWQNENRESS
jgi:hypothetical protein